MSDNTETEKEGSSSTPVSVTATEKSKARTEAPTLTAGRALDALVAEKVMGWRQFYDLDADALRWCDDARGKIGRLTTDWTPSMSIADAWEVLHMMTAPGFWVNIKADGAGQFTVEWMTHDENDNPYWLAEVTDVDSAPLAICLAALRETR